MDDVIVKGTVLGFNTNHFLLEYTYDSKTIICTKHKAEIVQKDLK